MIPAVLYISYDGMLEPLGESQVVSYLELLSTDTKIFLISYEKQDDWRGIDRRQAMKNKLGASNVYWIPLKYHNSPGLLATVYDVAAGIFVAGRLLKKHDIRIIHARSYVAAVIALFFKKCFSVGFLFDMRGFWADERVDAGYWNKSGYLYRIVKRLEQSFLVNADSVVALTHCAVKEMRQFPYFGGDIPDFDIITTCTDLNIFSLAPLYGVRSDAVLNIGYVGSVDGGYLFDEVLIFFKMLKNKMPNVHLKIVNKGQHEFIFEKLKSFDLISSSSVEELTRMEMPHAMREMSLGVFFYKPSYARKATAPTKMGEFLGCGVPCITNRGVGDAEEILTSGRVGVALEDFNKESMEKGLSAVLELVADPDIRSRCALVSKNQFSIEDGVRKYRKIYRKIGFANKF